jgi:autotransporter-associated beta strand protein
MRIHIGHYRLPLCAAALCLCILPLQAGVMMFRGNSDDYSFPGGTWDYNNTAKWLAPGSTTQIPWTSADDIALIVNYTNSWGSTTLTIDNAFGTVEASGIIITNEMKTSHHNFFVGAPLKIGNNGISVYPTNNTSRVYFDAPVILTASQTWRHPKLINLSNAPSFQVSNVVSSASGTTTHLTFDGFNRVDPGLNADTSYHPMFGLRNNNTFSGSTSVSGSAALALMFTPSFPGQKIDSACPLVLNAGTLVMIGNSATFTQTVSSVVIKAGANNLTGKNGKGAFICNSLVRDGVGGTVNFANISSGGVDFYTTNSNETGILGGWATSLNDRFAYTNGAGLISGLAGSQCQYPDNWGNNMNIQIRNSGTRTLGDVSPNSIRHGVVATNNLGEAVVTVKSGGIMTHLGNSRLTGGKIRSGMSTGELFVYAFASFIIDSVIEDNGAVPCILVKSGTDVLTLSGVSTFSGGTYLNSGTLALTGSASMSGLCHQAGGTTLQLTSGAKLACGDDGRVLGGNLALGGGAVLDLVVGAKDGGEDIVPITLGNRFASFTTTATVANPVTIAITVPEGVELHRGTYRLIEWASGVAVTGLTSEAFELAMPYYAGGEVAVSASGLDLIVTRVSKGTVLVVK